MTNEKVMYAVNGAVFNGVIYRKQGNGYYSVNINGKTKYLHRDVWVYYNGEIPTGYQVHHNISRDYNDIDGLVCLEETRHKSHHMVIRNRDIEKHKYICFICNEEFLSPHKYKSGDITLCTNSCRKKYVYAYQPEVRACDRCGKEFFAHKNKPRRFCSYECAVKKELSKCLNCGIEYERKSHTHQFCSVSCRDKYRWAQKHPKEERTCPHCKKMFIPTTTKQVYCKNMCGQAERTLAYRRRKREALKNNKEN